MKVTTILSRKGHDVEVIGPDAPLTIALHRMASRGIGCLVVVSPEQRVLGVLAERDIVRGLARHEAGLLRRHVHDVVSHGTPVTCAPDDELAVVMQRMTLSRQRHLPVVDHGRLIGIISIGDVVKHRLDELELETHVLRDAYLAKG